MKFFSIIQLTACALITCFALTLTAQNSMRALFIGVSNYPDDSGWNKLNAQNDLQLLRDILVEKDDVPADNIQLLEDEDATLAGIEQAIEDLIANSRPGESAWVHFSGHGQQVQDDNSDEIDGLDEALVPYDAKKEWEAGSYEGEKHLRDENLGKKLFRLRLKLGQKGKLVVTVDACHSGTGTRGYGNARGTDVIMADPEWLRQLSISAPVALRDTILEAQDNNPDAAPMVMLFSSAPHELSFETNVSGSECGLFTCALAKAYRQAGENATFDAVFLDLRQQMLGVTTQQTPQAEGDLFLRVNGGASNALKGVFEVKEIHDETYITVKGGTVQGLVPGTRIALYPAAITDTTGKSPLTSGVVEIGDLFAADVALHQAVAKGEAMQSRAWIVQAGIPFEPAAMKIDLPAGPFREALIGQLPKYPFILPAKDRMPDVILRGGDQIELIGIDDRVLLELTKEMPVETAIKAIMERTQLYLKARYMRQLEQKDPLLKAEMRLLYLDSQMPAEGRSFAPGTELLLEIRNTGKDPFYFSILDILPNDSIKPAPVFRPAAEFRLLPGEQYISEYYFEVEQESPEVIKLFLAPEPIDFYWMDTPRGAAPDNEFFKLLIPDELRQEVAGNVSRGGGSIPGSGSVISLTFETRSNAP